MSSETNEQLSMWLLFIVTIHYLENKHNIENVDKSSDKSKANNFD